MALADSLGQVFNLPNPTQQMRGVGSGRGAGRGSSVEMNDEYFGLNKGPEGLQYTDQVDQQSRQVFQRWNDLRNFAQSMWSMYGIDVTRPDGRPESVAVNQAFNQERANIQYEIDKLKESGEMAQQLNPMFAAGTITPTNQYGQAALATQLPQEAYAFTGLTEPSEKVISSLSKSFERGSDYNKAVSQGQAYVQSLRAAGRNREADDVEKALMPSVDVHYDSGSGSGDKTKASTAEFLKRLSGVVAGAANYKTSDVYNDPSTGQPLATTKEFNDAFEGTDRKTGKEVKGIIQEILKNPTTGQVYLKMSTQDDLIPVSGSELMYGISKANPKYPSVDKLTNFLGEFGGSDNVGELMPEYFLDKSAVKKAQENKARIDQESVGIAATDEQIRQSIQGSYQGSGWTRWAQPNAVSPPLSKLNNTSVEFQRDNEGLIVINNEADIKAKLKANGYSPEETNKMMKMAKTEEGLFKFLKQFGAAAPQAKKTIKRADLAAKAAASGYTPEEYEQLLIQRGIQIE